MLTCSNCSELAVYSYTISEDYHVHYCGQHLPRFLNSRRDAGLLPLITATPEIEAPVVSKNKKATSAIVDPAIEDLGLTTDATN
jgi:hypothetical protein